MTEPRTARAPRTRRARPEPTVAPVVKTAECNLPGCDAAPEWRGLCSAHRQTHRGLADPKEDPRV